MNSDGKEKEEKGRECKLSREEDRQIEVSLLHLDTCSLIAKADRVLCHLIMFLPSFFTGSTKSNTAAIKIRLLFLAGVFIVVVVVVVVVEKCAT